MTGAASGVGQATALLLASVGARVTLADRDGEAPQAVAHEISESGHDAQAVPTDIQDGA